MSSEPADSCAPSVPTPTTFLSFVSSFGMANEADLRKNLGIFLLRCKHRRRQVPAEGESCEMARLVQSEPILFNR